MDALLLQQIDTYLEENFIDTENIRYSVNLAPSYIDRVKEMIKALFEKPEDTFSERLLKLIDEQGRTDVEIYKKAHMDRRVFSKIRSDRDYTPSRHSAISLALALHLDTEAAEDLLNRAGYGLSTCRKEDLIIRFFIEHQQFDIFQINEVLEYYGLPILGKSKTDAAQDSN